MLAWPSIHQWTFKLQLFHGTGINCTVRQHWRKNLSTQDPVKHSVLQVVRFDKLSYLGRFEYDTIHTSNIWWQMCLNLCLTGTKLYIINRTGVAGAVLQTPPWLIHLLRDVLWKYLHNSVYPKPLELGIWHFETMLTTPCVSCVTCHVSRDMWHMTHDMGHVREKNDRLVELVGRGSVIKRSYPV